MWCWSLEHPLLVPENLFRQLQASWVFLCLGIIIQHPLWWHIEVGIIQLVLLVLLYLVLLLVVMNVLLVLLPPIFTPIKLIFVLVVMI